MAQHWIGWNSYNLPQHFAHMLNGFSYYKTGIRGAFSPSLWNKQISNQDKNQQEGLRSQSYLSAAWPVMANRHFNSEAQFLSSLQIYLACVKPIQLQVWILTIEEHQQSMFRVVNPHSQKYSHLLPPPWTSPTWSQRDTRIGRGRMGKQRGEPTPCPLSKEPAINWFSPPQVRDSQLQ